ncbi:MORN repeat-containing protein 2-like isoform X2 [Physella acuta]|uniref:MORN repeat-containing protein 2-like isoform X2 n=1 Tax=Physella acuta TaxID=109671 RepID=UPI0027DACE9A|nr:MORN repeat-containing protein 2-like isoform X2 [Physella acuta]
MGGEKKDKKKEKPEVSLDNSTCVYIFPNGDRYGSWKNDCMNGKGKLTHPSNASYEGEFVNNQFHGFGKYTWSNGSYYEGNFVENRLEGEGEYHDTEGQIWTGTFHYKAAPGLKFKLQLN